MWIKVLLILNLFSCSWIQDSSADPIAYTLRELSVKRGTSDYLYFYQDCPLQHAIHFQKRLPERLSALGIQDARYSSQSAISESCRRRNCELRCSVEVESLSNEFMFEIISSTLRRGTNAALDCKRDRTTLDQQTETIWTKIITDESNQCFVEAIRIYPF